MSSTMKEIKSNFILEIYFSRLQESTRENSHENGFKTRSKLKKSHFQALPGKNSQNPFKNEN